ncbi:hypothetical protein QA601_01150 [Chitinispirillales bacterium ANBcel5]|uniref:hypothetical protein n=1 Tax=Cellulosispirillum alkaliphilum TaxID=3039283 RepID=UPI002A4E9E4D|nr:hypothetical protein [Chitinispirillales bacterium ANBcel5]
MGKTIFALLCCIIAFSQAAFAQGLVFELPKIEGFHPLDYQDLTSPLNSKSPRILDLNTTLFSDTAIINFENRQITFMRKDELGFAVWAYHYSELNDYLLSRNNYLLRNNWHEGVLEKLKEGEEEEDDRRSRLELALPVHYPSWAQRLIGTEPPRLSVSGSLTMGIEYDRTTVRTGELENTGPGFNFTSDHHFSITGSIGRLISINISASDDDGFGLDNPLQNFKIEYTENTPGELEDEIIQEVVVGYTGFDMPGTSLSGYSERHEGLFGIKMRGKLGPLMLTTILSHAQGESERLTAERQTGVEVFREDDFVKNRFFFLDTLYKRYWNQKYYYDDETSPPRVDAVQILKRMTSFDRAEVDRASDRTWVRGRAGSPDIAEFEVLIEDRDYFLNREEGWIRFKEKQYISDNDLIAFTLRTDDGSLNKGQFADTQDGDDSRVYDFEVLKPDNMRDRASNDPTYHLMWRNVYRISSSRDRSNFRLNFQYVPYGTNDTSSSVSGKFIGDILGVTENNSPKHDNPDIFDWDNGYLIIPPFDSTFHGNEPFSNPALGELADTTIYRYGHNSPEFREYNPLFVIRTSGTTVGTSFNLGWGVMRGTVRVTAGGEVFEENVDYVVNYDMGTLDLVSPRAQSRAEDVEIEYQRESLFVPERQWFFGTRGELQLPFFSDRSFAAMNFLYQGTNSNQTPYLGNEPHGKMLLNFNTRLDFEPQWMTGLVNALPLINTTAKSSALFDFEVAFSNMNPNRRGSAYVDDFERVRQSYALSLSHRSWHMASFPFDGEDILERPPAWDFYWFTPISYDSKHRIPRHHVWSNVQTTRVEYENVLRLHTTPGHPVDSLTDRFANSYASIMTPFHSNAMNLEKADYLEVLLQPDTNLATGRGKLTIQIGQMKEDQVRHGGPPNQKADAEDPLRRGEIRSELDLGLDGLPDSLEYYLIPNANASAWDTLWYGDSLLLYPDDPSGDNYREYNSSSNAGDYRFVNGTERNSRMDSEDILNNGQVRIFQDEWYYSYTIDLDLDDLPFIDTSAALVTEKGWRLYRIPIKEVLDGVRDSVGDPSWRDVDMVRLVWHDFNEYNLTTEHQLVIANMEFVGNEWEVVPNVLPDSGEVFKIEASSISNHENEDFRRSLNRDLPFRPDSTRDHGLELEQALRLNFHDLEVGDTALVRRNLSRMSQDISPYDSLTFYIHGDENAPYNEDVKFVFRFGHNDSTFYEYRTVINSSWDDNYNAISLNDFSDLKLTVDFDNQPIDITSEDGSMRIVAPPNMRPNFANITYMALGVYKEGVGVTPRSGEVWVNDMRVVGARKLRGWASRASVRTQWSDFMNFSASMDYNDADFRRMVDNDITAQNSRLSGNFSVGANLDKFMPDNWGISLPVGASVSGTITRPQQAPGSDISLMGENNRPDVLRDMGADALNMIFGRDLFKSDTSLAQLFESQNVSRSAYATFEKRTTSDNLFVNMTLDRIRAEVRYNENASMTGRGLHPHPDTLNYVTLDSTTTYSGRLNYDLSPGNNLSWTPFRNSDLPWLPDEVKRYEINLLPRTINFDLAEVSYRKERNIRTDAEPVFAPPTSYTFGLNHGMRVEYSPIRPLLNLNYSLNIQRDLSESGGFSRDEMWGVMRNNIFSLNDNWDPRYMILHGERRRTQSAGIRFEPRIFNWLTHNFNYSGNYESNLRSSTGAAARDRFDATVNTSFEVRTSLRLNTLFNELGSRAVIGDFFSLIGDGFQNIELRSVDFDYITSTELRNFNLDSEFLETANVSGLDFFKYQIGVKGRSLSDIFNAHMDDYYALGGMNFWSRHGESDYSRNYRLGTRRRSFSTRFSIPEPFRVNFTNVSFGWSEEFRVQPDTARVDTSYIEPEIRISANSPLLMDIGYLDDVFQRLNLSSTLNFTKSRNVNSLSTVRESKTTVFDWGPLIGIDGTLRRWPVNFNFRRTLNKKKESTREIIRSGNNFTLSYEITQSSAIDDITLFNRTIPVRGRTNIGLNITTTNEEEILEDAEDQDPINRSELRIQPNISYTFTDNITGRMEFQHYKNKRGDEERTSNTFALLVTIRL